MMQESIIRAVSIRWGNHKLLCNPNSIFPMSHGGGNGQGWTLTTSNNRQTCRV